MEPPEDRIAKRLEEINKQQAALDRDDAQRGAADDDHVNTVVDRRRGGALRSAAFLILLIAVAAGLFGLAVTFTRLAGKDVHDAQRQGTAQVSSCRQHGPISNKGFGYWYRCTATIAWDDATPARVVADSVFTPSDIGNEVRVGDLGNYRTRTELARADEVRRPWLAWLGYAVGAVALLPTLVATLALRELLRFRRRAR